MCQGGYVFRIRFSLANYKNDRFQGCTPQYFIKRKTQKLLSLAGMQCCKKRQKHSFCLLYKLAVSAAG